MKPPAGNFSNKSRLAAGCIALALMQTAPGLAAGQTREQPAPQIYQPAPWWMREPVVAVTGKARTEVPANRASFSAAFKVVKSQAASATQAAADRVRELGEILRKFDSDKVHTETTFSIQPLYQQHENEAGNLVDNRRADKIESYEATANVQIELRDTGLVERVYSAVIGAQPTSVGQVYFRLEPDNATQTKLYGDAVADAAERARLSVERAGTHLGPIRLIDPSGRACEADVLITGAPRGGDNSPGYRFAAPMPAPPPAMQGTPTRQAEGSAPDPKLGPLLPLQVPLLELNDRVCVVYSLSGG